MSFKWLPNAISIFRIALIVPVVYGILDGRFLTALGLFLAAGLSDGVDGFLAKRFGWRSRLGALLDPLADKFLTASSYVTLAVVGQIPVWLAGVVVLRDLVIMGGATAYNFLIAPVQGEPTRISKLNTALELSFVVCVLARAGTGWPGETPVTVLGAAVLVTVIVSGADYVFAWSRRALSERRRAAGGGSEA